VEVYNVTNGERLATYLIKEQAGSGKIGVYGAAAHKSKRTILSLLLLMAVWKRLRCQITGQKSFSWMKITG